MWLPLCSVVGIRVPEASKEYSNNDDGRFENEEMEMRKWVMRYQSQEQDGRLCHGEHSGMHRSVVGICH